MNRRAFLSALASVGAASCVPFGLKGTAPAVAAEYVALPMWAHDGSGGYVPVTVDGDGRLYCDLQWSAEDLDVLCAQQKQPLVFNLIGGRRGDQ